VLYGNRLRPLAVATAAMILLAVGLVFFYAPVEADQILGDLLARAHKASIGTPLLATAYTHLSVYQNRLSAR